MPNLRVLLMMLLALISLYPLQAQTSETCPASVVDAVRAIGATCDNQERNSACYGSDHVEASFSQPVDAGLFDQPSDRAALDLFESIRTTPFDALTGRWGAAVLKLQANIPGSLPGQVVTMLLIGDAQVQNAADPTTQTPMQAFTFTTGVAPSCDQLPPSSLILQGPRGMVVDLTINGANVRLGSTAVLRTGEGWIEFTTLDGRVVVDEETIISKGFWTSADLDENGMIIEDSWDEVELMDTEDLEFLEDFEELSDEVFEYDLELPEEEELELLETFDPEFIDDIDPYTLDEMLDSLLAEGIDGADLAELSDEEYYQFLYDSLAAADPELGDAFYEAATGEDVDGDGLIAGFDSEAYYSGDDFYSYDEDLALSDLEDADFTEEGLESLPGTGEEDSEILDDSADATDTGEYDLGAESIDEVPLDEVIPGEDSSAEDGE